MFSRAARLILRLAGWLLTPFVVTVAALFGATIGLMVAPSFSPGTGLILTIALGFAAAVTGLLFWMRLLRRNPELREALAVTPEGIPETHEEGPQ